MLKVGAVVKLNDMGIQIIGGLKSSAEVEQAKRMIITKVEEMGTNDDGSPFYAIEVDQSLINRYMLADWHVTLLNQ